MLGLSYCKVVLNSLYLQILIINIFTYTQK